MEIIESPLNGLSLEGLAEVANQAASNAEQDVESAVSNAITSGNALIAAKSKCRHGEWLHWLEENWEFSDRLARRYMEAAKRNGGSDLERPCQATEILRILVEDDADCALVESTTFACSTCGDEFDQPVWHCPDCNHHWTEDICVCRNCHQEEELDEEGDEIPDVLGDDESGENDKIEDPGVAEAELAAPQKNYFTLGEWGELTAAEACFESDRTFNKQDNASIEWAQWSWNPITGCKHDCPYCYARDIANRFYPQKFEPSIYPERFAAPRNTRVPDKADVDTSYRNVFTGSMADLFGRWVPEEWIDLVLDVVRNSPKWNFLFLTKFPQRIHEFGEVPKNAWMGTTVDCQARVTNAETAFAKMGGGIKWLSVEPMLTPLKFKRLEMFDWVVIGGASKSVSTPAWAPDLDWVVDLHMQARQAGCAIYYKDNLPLSGEFRLREFPWEPRKERQLPDSLKYLGIQ